MKKKWQSPKVENIALAVVPGFSDDGSQHWVVHLLNMRNEDIDGVMVSSKGYGKKDGKPVETGVLRHFLDQIPAQSTQQIELIMPETTGLSNEYLVSFFANKVMYDKKYIFLPETLQEGFFTSVPLLDVKGILLR